MNNLLAHIFVDPTNIDMAKIAVSCSICGDKRLQPDQLVLKIGSEQSSYSFSCPDCNTHYTFEIPPGAIEQLLEVGVPVEYTAAPITEDEHRQFCEALSNIDDLVGVLLSEPPKI